MIYETKANLVYKSIKRCGQKGKLELHHSVFKVGVLPILPNYQMEILNTKTQNEKKNVLGLFVPA